MKGKISLLAGVGIGYVLGARAGRERYETIVESASTAAEKVRRDPRVQDAAAQAQEMAKEKAAAAADTAKDAAQSAQAKVNGSSGDQTNTGSAGA